MPDKHLSQLAGAINKNLYEAIAAYEMFVPSGQNPVLIDRVNGAEAHPGFNVISDALHQKAVLALCRLWDKKNASIPRAAQRLSLEQTVKAVEVRREEPLDRGSLDDWLRRVREVQSSDELTALQTTRNRHLAHTADPNIEYSGPARQTVYGDERYVLEDTILISTQLSAFVVLNHAPWGYVREAWNKRSSFFWDHVAPHIH